jgi:hypothetical protein
MLHKRHLISVAVGAIFLLTLGATSVSAADAPKDGGHQHHGHQCHDKMSAVDLNKDSKISKEEFMKHHEAMFDKKDTNKDGFLDESEMHKMMDHMHQHKHDQKKEGAHAH